MVKYSLLRKNGNLNKSLTTEKYGDEDYLTC